MKCSPLYKFFLLLLLLNACTVLPLSAQFREVHSEFQTSLEACGDCLTGTYSSTRLRNLDKIGGLLEKMGTTKTFTEHYLKSQIAGTLIKVNLRLLEKQQTDPLKLQRCVSILKNLCDAYRDSDEAYQEWDRSPRAEKRILDIETTSKVDFADIIWKKYYEEPRVLIQRADEMIYEYMTPQKSLKQLSEFIERTTILGQLNTRTEKAFLLYYQKLTADGEISTLRNFQTYITREKYSASGLWNDLFQKKEFQKIYEDDKARALKWGNIVNTSRPDQDALRRLIKASAPRETALTALQKLFRDVPARALPDSLLKYQPFFQTKEVAYAGVSAKYANWLQWAANKRESSIEYQFTPVSGISPGAPAIEYFLNPRHDRLALLPRTLETQKKVQVYPLSKMKQSGQTTLVDYNPDLVFYFDRTDPQQIKNARIQDFKLHKINTAGAFFSDYFISYKYKIAFFVTSGIYERMDTTAGRSEFNAPCLPQTEISAGKFFEEDDNRQPFHGRENGNFNTDIYYCLYDGVNWSDPHLLIGTKDEYGVNSPFSERSPVLSEDGRYLYFSSEGHGGFGGYDVFRVGIDVKIGKIDGELENLYEINSYADDLFYNPAIQDKACISSNRGGGKYTVYSIEQAAKDPEPQNVDIPKTADTTYTELEEGNTDIKITAKCETITRDDNMEDGMIKITGEIKYRNGKLAEKAEIRFYMNNYSTQLGKTDLSKGLKKYTVIVPDTSKEILIKVIAFGPEGKIRAEFHHVLDSLCDNRNKTYQYRYDPLLSTEESIQRNGEYLYMPFFFETNSSSIGIMSKFYILQYYRDIIRDNADKNLRFHFIGYTDERGDKDYNCRLAARRAEAVKDYFITTLGLQTAKANAMASKECESINQTPQDLQQFRAAILKDISRMSARDRALLANRRVMVYLGK